MTKKPSLKESVCNRCFDKRGKGHSEKSKKDCKGENTKGEKKGERDTKSFTLGKEKKRSWGEKGIREGDLSCHQRCKIDFHTS